MQGPYNIAYTAAMCTADHCITSNMKNIVWTSYVVPNESGFAANAPCL